MVVQEPAEQLPRVSTVVPVYRGEDYIYDLIVRFEECRARCNDLYHELIFICDDPCDNSRELISTLSRNRPWIRSYELASNGGQHLSTAVGMLHTEGDWIVTIDEDLQHPPEVIPELLLKTLEQGFDLTYVKSRTATHTRHGKYRDLSSIMAKRLLATLTRDDFSITSSFRAVRGTIARGVALTVDRYAYLDAVLFGATSRKRRGVFQADFSDPRMKGQSGYTFTKLLRHYGRLLSSIDLSITALFVIGSAILACVLLGGTVAHLYLGLQSGARTIAPGWASIYGLLSILVSGLFIYCLVSIKYLSILVQRSSNSRSFLLIDRREDKNHLRLLRKLIERYPHS